MTTDELLDLFRSEMKDAEEPYFWSDAEVYAYLDDAQKMFCRLTDGVSDATTPAVVDIEVAEGDTWLDLHPAILKIRGATRTSDGQELKVLNYEDLADLGVKFDSSTSTVTTLIVGMEEDKVRLHAAATADDNIKLLVFRLPLTTLAEDVQELEIKDHHHLHLLPWAKHLALLKQDAETFDKNKAADMELIFRSYCAKAKQEQGMKRHKRRSVVYGGL